MNLDLDFLQVSKLSEDQKKSLHQKWNTFSPNSGEDQKKKRPSPDVEQIFPPNSCGHLRSDAHQRQIIGGNADVDHSQTIGEDTAKLLGGYIPPPPPGFGTSGSVLCYKTKLHP